MYDILVLHTGQGISSWGTKAPAQRLYDEIKVGGVRLQTVGYISGEEVLTELRGPGDQHSCRSRGLGICLHTSVCRKRICIGRGE